MSIYIGGSCVGWGSTTPDTTVNEIRFVQSERHHPIDWNTVEMSLANKIKMIINIDSYGDGSDRGWHNELNLRSFTEEIIRELLRRANNSGINHSYLKKFCRLTFDNEADEIYAKEQYAHYLGIFYSQVNKRFDVGAGNFNGHRTDYHNYICKNSPFEVIDIHLQKDFETKSKVDKNIYWYRDLAKRYGKRLSCTEANPTSNDIWTPGGFELLHHQLKRSIEIGCEDFCTVFIKQPDEDKYANLSFILNNGKINPYWDKFKKIIKDNKPIQTIPEPIIEGDEDMILVTMKRGVIHPAVRWLQQILEKDYGVVNDYGKYDGDFGAATERQVIAYQKKIGLEQTGIIRATDVIKIIEDSSDSNLWYKRLTIYASYR